MRFRDGSDGEWPSDFTQISEDFDGDNCSGGNMKQSWVFGWKGPNTQKSEIVVLLESKVKSILVIFFNINGVVLKEFVLEAKQSFQHNTVML
jgi:hypothetical protein